MKVRKRGLAMIQAVDGCGLARHTMFARKFVITKMEMFRRSKIGVLCVCALVLCSLARPSISSGAGFSVTGNGRSRSFKKGDENPVQEIAFTFQVCVKDCFWRISVESSNVYSPPPTPHPELASVRNLTALNAYSWDAGTDGTNILYVESWQQPGWAAVEGGKPTRGYTARISKGIVPHPDMEVPVVSILWYTYASACYLDKMKGSNFLELPFDLIQRNPYDFDYLQNAEWERNSAPPFLPSVIRFQHPGRVKQWEKLTDPWASKPPEYRALPPPFDRGFILARYSVDQFDEVGGLSLPGRFEYRAFVPVLTSRQVPSPAGDNLLLGLACDFKRDQAAPLPEGFVFVPPAPEGSFRVIDERLVGDSPPFLASFTKHPIRGPQKSKFAAASSSGSSLQSRQARRCGHPRSEFLLSSRG
jgi:hypothetical protein